MKNRNYIFNKERLTKNEIDQFMDFDDVLLRANAQADSSITREVSRGKTLSFKTISIVTLIGAAACLGIFWMIGGSDRFIENNETPMVIEDSSTQKLQISAPFPEEDVRYETYTIPANQNTQIETNNGSLIEIPAYTFVNSEGGSVEGNITIKYREFHNPVDIFRAGIPMSYDSGNTDYTFISAGMFEIDALQGDQQLKVEENKSLIVNLVSLDVSENFNEYYFDKDKGTWVYLDQSEQIAVGPGMKQSSDAPTINPTQELVSNSELALVAPAEPRLPKILKDKYSFEVQKNLLISNGLPANTLFQIDEDLSPFNPIYYEVKWEKIELKKSEYENHYTLYLTKGDQMVSLEAYPAVSEEEYERSWREYRNAKKVYDEFIREYSQSDTATNQYAEYYLRQRQEINSMEQDFLKVMPEEKNVSFRQRFNSNKKKVQRPVQVTRLGMYNCDTPIPAKNLVPAAAVFIPVLLNKVREMIRFNSGYNSVKGVNTLLQFNSNSRLTYSRKADNVIWAITSDMKIAIVEDFDPKRVNSTREVTCSVYEPKEGLKKLDQLLN